MYDWLLRYRGGISGIVLQTMYVLTKQWALLLGVYDKSEPVTNGAGSNATITAHPHEQHVEEELNSNL